MTGAGRTLVLLRHGRTAWNHLRRVQGQHDVGLDDVGHEQAARTAPAIAALAPDVVWCSDLRRTRETAVPLAAATSLDVVHDPRLREFSFGSWEGRTHGELAQHDAAGYQALLAGDYDQIADAERSTAVRDRMTDVLHELTAGLADGGTAVAVSHGAAIRVATAALLGWPDGQYRSLRGLDNCGWVVLQASARAGDGWRLAAYNRVA